MMGFRQKRAFWLPVLALFAWGAVAQKLDDSIHYFVLKVGSPTIDDNRQSFDRLFVNTFGVEDPITGYRLEEQDWAARVVEGLRFSRYLVLEGNLVYFGLTDIFGTTQAGDTIRIESESYGGGLSLLGMYPIYKGLTVHAQAGGAYWRAEFDMRSDAGTIDEASQTGVDLAVGAGLRYNFDDRILFELNWDRTEFYDWDVTMFTLGIGFTY